MAKNKLYRVNFEIYEYGEEYVRARSKKEAIKKVQDSPSADCGGSDYSAEIVDDDEECEETI